MKNIDAFFAFARERHRINILRMLGKPAPWTADPILAKYKFTNVFRELDRTTVWFRNHIREPLRNDPQVLFATVAFRWFNRIETAAILKNAGDQIRFGDIIDLFLQWNTGEAEKRLRTAMPNGPWTNGAYIIKTPDGMDKLKGVLWCIDNYLKKHNEILALLTPPLVSGKPGFPGTIQFAWAMLRQIPYLGDFMAYEVVTDLRHTYLLENAPDIMTWANPGPGACRGFGRVNGNGPEYYQRTNETHRNRVIAGMQELLAASKGCGDENGYHPYWPDSWPQWEMREVEHTLCEFDKYERARLGEGRPKQLYHYR